MHEELTITNYMKYKRHLMGSMLALTIIVSGSSAFAADTYTATSTKSHMFRNQVKMKSNESDGRVDIKDANGKDLETNDDKTVSSIKMHGTKNSESNKTMHRKLATDRKEKVMRIYKNHKETTASSTKSI